MKAASIAAGWPCVGRLQVALTWCVCALWCAPVAGRFLLQKQAPPATASADAAVHIKENMAKLHQEGDAAVANQKAVIHATALRKEALAKDAIEMEIPAASAADTQELSKDVGAEDAALQAALQKSTAEAKEGMEVLKDKTAMAVNMSAVRTVRDVEKQYEDGAADISEHSVQLQAEAEALANEAAGAANASQEAAKNSKLWVAELPVKDAAEAVVVAKESEKESARLRHEYEDVKRIAKLAGNKALATIELSKQALEQADEAKLDATKAAEQAAENALLLNTIFEQTSKASSTAMWVVDQMKQDR